MRVTLTSEARAELRDLPPTEQAALIRALDKLEAAGDRLGFPHTSAVRNAPETLRELRPRRGSCAWRALYRRVGQRLVVAAIGPEAVANPHGFERAVAAAISRLAKLEADTDV